MKLESFKDPYKVIGKLTNMHLMDWIPDKQYLSLLYFAKFGKKLNLKNPQTFNEKLQCLKLFDRNPEYTKLVDKYAVREYITRIIGEEYLIPLIGGPWNKFDEIDFEKLPNQFVLKCTHDSGGLIICKDKASFDLNAAKVKITNSLKRNYYWHNREWPYKDVPPKIIAEKYMVDESGTELKDYKIFNFYGVSKMIQVDYGRFTEHKRNLYTTDWEYVPVSIKYPTDPIVYIPKPQRLTEMLQLARKLSEEIPHLRTDFYSINEHIYFGELTFYHGSGMEVFDPEEWDYKFGNWLKLPERTTV